MTVASETTDQIWAVLRTQVQREAQNSALQKVARDILIGPYVTTYGETRGFTVRFGERQVGWWSSREEACAVAEQLHAVLQWYEEK